MQFSGFSAEGLRFLQNLAKNNDRSWFNPRKTIYENELLEPLRALAADATVALGKANIPLGADPRRSLFRIYRDIRFSPDKSPYKTNLGVFLPHEGDYSSPGGIYIHVQPKHSFMAVAFYRIDKSLLQRWRGAMADEPKRFEAMLRALDRNGVKLSEQEDLLKRMPRGFESFADSSIATYFRFSSFTVAGPLSDEELRTKHLIERIVAHAKKAKPLLDYGWSVLS